jgi:membrane fusion protein (multidrug efflux system)
LKIFPSEEVSARVVRRRGCDRSTQDPGVPDRIPTLSPILALLLLGPVLAITACSSGSSTKTQPASPVTVVVTTLQPHTVPIYGEFVGDTEAAATVQIHAQVTGFLQKIAFKEGSVVKKGQLLFVIDPRPYLDSLQEAKATLAVDQATVNNTEQIVKRYTPLAQRHAISQLELDSEIATAKENQANVVLAQAQVAAAQLNVNYTKVITPMTGDIGTSQVKVGDLIQSGSTLMDTVYSLTPMYVTFGISENSYLEYVERHKKDPHHTPAIQLILGNGTTYGQSGTLNMVSPSVNTSTGTLQLRASFPNPQSELKPGLFVRVRFVVRDAENALLVPQSAIQQLQGTQSVLLVGSGNKVQQTTITTGDMVGNYEIVKSGLKAGDVLIVEGTQKVQPGAEVKTQQVAEQIPNTEQPANSQTASDSTSQNSGPTAQ